MNRRGVVLGGAAVAAAAAGVAWQLRHDRQRPDDLDAFWAMRFPQPGGGELVMAERRGKPLLLNFWATWCPPCVKEMPALDRFYRRFAPQGWQVVGLAVDGPTPVREFLQRVEVGFAIGLAGMEGTDLSTHLGNSQGALPFTVVFDRQGRVAQRKLGESSDAELIHWATLA